MDSKATTYMSDGECARSAPERVGATPDLVFDRQNTNRASDPGRRHPWCDAPKSREVRKPSNTSAATISDFQSRTPKVPNRDPLLRRRYRLPRTARAGPRQLAAPRVQWFS